MEDLAIQAMKNVFIRLKGDQNPYPGRGIVLGVNSSGKSLVQIYWIMGRSDSSRNRIFVKDDNGVLRTEAVDAAKIKDPKLIIYRAMREFNNCLVVSNGDQTDTVISGLGSGSGLELALKYCHYEPDPNHTPRITGMTTRTGKKSLAQLSIIRKLPWSNESSRSLFTYDNIAPGYGFCVTTYVGDAPEGGLLPPFKGEPFVVPIIDSIEDVADYFWDTLNEDNRVALAVKFLDIDTATSSIHIINKYSKV